MAVLSRVIAVILCLAWTTADAGEVRLEQSAPSPALGGEVIYGIYLPDGYDAPGARFPVIYLLHGYGGGHREWFKGGQIDALLDRLIDEGAIPPVIAVTPAAGKSWYVDSARFGGPGDYATAIARDLVVAVDAAWPTVAMREGRAIVGNSMGGHGALRLGLGHPDLFGTIAALSPAIWKPGGVSWRLSPQFGDGEALEKWFPRTTGAQFDRAVLDTQSPFQHVATAAIHDPAPRVWLGTGDDDYFELQDGTVDMYLELRANGITPELRVIDGKHNWATWRRMTGDMIRWISAGFTPAAGR
ncbi:MAG: esterase family protein [Paracoccaceae bacterium]|nr:esterase family protein [Paracoccaceae bacterium]